MSGRNAAIRKDFASKKAAPLHESATRLDDPSFKP
jgi:hypothetical protein